MGSIRQMICVGIILSPFIVQSLPTDAAADEAERRSDPNSQAAHKALLTKARTGQIDLYFVGDSITRRWGTSDPEYKDLLAHWNSCFHGWNAANFGWGGDTVGNVLWRLRNGELEGVNPAVIVILAGTNDLAGTDAPDATCRKVVSGIQAILEVCQEKAPRATIVLTAIFPRNDQPGLTGTIEQINKSLAELADGKRIRYLNVNDKLADRDGRLFDGMTDDGLHPTVQGYQVWADGLRPILVELLGPPAPVDRAPPPTGNPRLN